MYGTLIDIFKNVWQVDDNKRPGSIEITIALATIARE